MFCVVFFFFQAEDGIRDFHVTGVQTCALPISYNKSSGMDEGGGEMSYRTAIAAASAVAFGLVSLAAQAAAEIPVGHLATYTGPTSDVGQPYGKGIEDAIEYINRNGGIDGRKIRRETVDYAYQTPRAIATYKGWVSRLKPVAILGWGTADTEALVRFVAQDQIPFISASYSGHLTDPTGKSPHTKT